MQPNEVSGRCEGRTGSDHERYHPPRSAALVAIPEKIGCSTQTLHAQVKKRERPARRRFPASFAPESARFQWIEVIDVVECELEALGTDFKIRSRAPGLISSSTSVASAEQRLTAAAWCGGKARAPG